MKKKYKVAVFNNEKEKVLIDFRQVEINVGEREHEELAKHLQRYGAYVGEHKEEGNIVIVPQECDLNTNNQYKWIDNGFCSLGFGFPRPKALPQGVNKEHVFYLIAKALSEGTPIPAKVGKWVVWYEENLKRRNEEHIKRGGGL